MRSRSSTHSPDLLGLGLPAGGQRAPRSAGSITVSREGLASAIWVSRLLVLGWSLLRLSLVARRGVDADGVIAAVVAAVFLVLVMKELP